MTVLKNTTIFDSLKKQQLLMEKIINPPMVEQIRQQTIMSENINNMVMGSNLFNNFDAFSTDASIAMKFDISLGVSGVMENLKISRSLFDAAFYNAKSTFGTKQTNNYLGVMGIKDNYVNLLEMVNGIQNLVNNTNYTSHIGASAVMAQNRYQNLLSNLNSFTQSDRFSSLFNEIDWGSLDEIDFDNIDEETEESNETKLRLQGSSELSATVTVVTPKKKLSDLTVDEFEDMVRRAIKKTKTLSIGAFLGIVFNDYIKDAGLVITEVFFALMISISVGSFNAEVKEQIKETIIESKNVRDARNVYKKHTNIPPIIGEQIAFLRTEAVLREGRSYKAPAIGKVSERTVLNIVNRKGNWLQVQIEMETGCNLGWVEESRVVKFKKVE